MTNDSNDVTSILWLLVAYNNMDEVDGYIDQLIAHRAPSTKAYYSVCDNSAEPQPSRHSRRDDYALTSRPDNPGYLDGAREAMANARSHGWASESWVSLSNTDLEWRSGDPGTHLRTLDHHTPRIIAPRITEGSSHLEKNPHVIHRRRRYRLAANRAATVTLATTMAYQTLAWVRQSRHDGPSPRADARRWAELHPPGESFYSPYGAVMFFSQGFDADQNLPQGVPLLAEEYFIAEKALSIGAEVSYQPAIHVHHTAHTTTGPKVTRRRARGTQIAFRAIHKHALKRDFRP